MSKSQKKPSARAKPAVRKVRKAPVRGASTRVAKTASIAPTSRERVYKLTREIPEHHYFILANGQPVKHVAELAAVLDQLEDHVFNHHVTPDRNDFQSWVRDVFEDLELARKISGVSSKEHLQLVIYRHLAGHD